VSALTSTIAAFTLQTFQNATVAAEQFLPVAADQPLPVATDRHHPYRNYRNRLPHSPFVPAVPHLPHVALPLPVLGSRVQPSLQFLQHWRLVVPIYLIVYFYFSALGLGAVLYRPLPTPRSLRVGNRRGGGGGVGMGPRPRGGRLSRDLAEFLCCCLPVAWPAAAGTDHPRLGGHQVVGGGWRIKPVGGWFFLSF